MTYKNNWLSATPILVTLLFLLHGCGGKFGPVTGQENARPHAVQVDRDGAVYEISDNCTKIDSFAGSDRMQKCADNDQFACKEQIKTEDRVFNGIISALDEFTPRKSTTKHVLIFFHGGTNNDLRSLKRVLKAREPMLDDDVFPIFINWRSGPFTTLHDHYFRIRDGQVDKIAKLTAPVYMVGDTFKILGNTPMVWWKEGQHSFKSVFMREDNELMQFCNKNNVFCTKDNEEFHYKRSGLWLLTSPVKIFSTPVAFTLGTPAWDNMKRRVQTMFVHSVDVQPPVSFDPEGRHEDTLLQTNGAALRFLQRFNQYIFEIKNNRPEEKIQVTLMGHSMGGLIVNQVLEHLPDMEVDNLVYMASADTLDNFLKAAIPFVKNRLSNDKDIYVYNLHLHPENEDRETMAGGMVPSGSILVWIDSIYSSPEFDLKRTMGCWKNMCKTMHLIPENIQNRFHYKVFGRSMEKHPPGPQGHSDFSQTEFRYWQKKFWYQ